jgi:anti-anti-sigma factor
MSINPVCSGRRFVGCRTKVRKGKGMPVLEIKGDFSGEAAAKAAVLLEEMRSSTGTGIAVDLSHTAFIDSVGLGVFVYCWRLLEKEHRDMTFIGPQGFVLKMFQSTSLDKIFKVVDAI